VRDIAWLVPVALAVHVAEEAPGFAAWARRHASPDYSDRDFVMINALGLGTTLAGTVATARGYVTDGTDGRIEHLTIGESPDAGS
jgi:hypothetical protein